MYKYDIVVLEPFEFFDEEDSYSVEGKECYYVSNVAVRIKDFYKGINIQGSFSAYKKGDKRLEIDWSPISGKGEIDGYYQLFAWSGEASQQFDRYFEKHSQMKKEIEEVFEEEWKKVRLRALFDPKKG